MLGLEVGLRLDLGLGKGLGKVGTWVGNRVEESEGGLSGIMVGARWG